MTRLALPFVILVAACAKSGGPYPSLAPRAAETIDPRIPVVVDVPRVPVTPALQARLDTLVAQARGAEGPFASAIAAAERLAAQAGARQSESWVVAQQALSAAVATREPVTRALGDLDAIGAEALEQRGGMAPADQAALRAAGEAVGAIDARQAAAVDAIARRLGG